MHRFVFKNGKNEKTTTIIIMSGCDKGKKKKKGFR
jgi:hypothetical protein